jgi:hypothetical protein
MSTPASGPSAYSVNSSMVQLGAATEPLSSVQVLLLPVPAATRTNCVAPPAQRTAAVSTIGLVAALRTFNQALAR